MKKYSFFLIYFYSPVLLATLIFISNPMKYAALPRLFSMLMGACAFTWLNWQFIISARPKYIESKIGMDKLYRFHGVMAFISLLLAFGHQIINNAVFSDNQMIRIGKVSILIFSIVSVISILFMVSSIITKKQPFKLLTKLVGKIMKFKYEHLLLMHNLTIIALVLMLVHVLMTSTVRNNRVVFAGYMTYFSLAFGFYFYHKVIKGWLKTTVKYNVTDVFKENTDIWRIELVAAGSGILFKPGQFAFFRFSRKYTSETHPFTVMPSSADSNKISVLVKELGDFTSEINTVKPGDKVYVDGPYGRFSYVNFPNEEQLVFLSGGIGITPAISMLRHMAVKEEKRKILLIWGIRREKDLIMKDMLNDLKHSLPNLEIVPVVSDENNYKGEKGFITIDLIYKLIFKYQIKLYKAGCYLCGPEIFMSIAKKALVELGARKEHIHDERFSL